MGDNSHNAYYLGVQIGIGRVYAALKNELAWKSLKYAKQNAKALHSAGLLDSINLAKLTEINSTHSSGLRTSYLGEGGLHDSLVGITENFGLMTTPYGTIYYFGFWIGIAEGQAYSGTPGSVPHKKAALRKAKEYASQLQKNYGINPNEISINADYATLLRSRKKWGETFRLHA